MARRESGALALQLSLIRSTFVSGSDDIDDTDFRVKKYSQNIYQEKTSVEKMIRWFNLSHPYNLFHTNKRYVSIVINWCAQVHMLTI